VARARTTTSLALAPLLLLTLLVLVVGSSVSSAAVSSAATAATSAAAYDDPTASGVALLGVTPLVAAPGRPVTLSGTLDVARLGLDLSPTPADGSTATPTPSPTSPGTEPPVTSPTVATLELRLGSRPPRTAEEVDAWLTASGPSDGTVVASAAVTAGADPESERVPFTLTLADVEEWASAAYGILPVSLEVRLPNATEPTGVLRTFLPYEVRKEYEPLQVTLVEPITVPRDLVLLGEFGDERTAAWEALLGEEGTLRQRLDAADDPRVAWALDPALLEPGPAPAEAPQDEEGDEDNGEDSGDEDSGEGAADEGTTPTPPPGTTTSQGAEAPGTPTSTPTTSTPTTSVPGGEPEEDDPAVREHQIRARFAADLLEAVDGRTVLLLPRHDADLGALVDPTTGASAPEAVRGLLTPTLDVAAARESLAAAGAVVTPTVWPAEGVWSAAHDTALADLVASAGAEAAAVGSAESTTWTVLPSSDVLEEPVRGPFPSASGLPVAPYDAVLSRAVGTAHDEASTMTAGLAMTAHSLIELNDLPGTTRHRVIVLQRDSAATSAAADIAAVIDAVPWLELADLTAADDDGALVALATPAEPPVLADSRADNLSTTVQRLPVAASVRAADGADLATRGADVLDQLVSLRWRGAAEDWTTAYQPIGMDVSEVFTGLSIPSRDISFLADSGLLRVTVENALDTDIENAVLDLTVEDPILRVESGPQPVEVGADSRTTVGFDAVAIASGRVEVTATLRGPDGTVLGEPTSFSVRVSPTADWIYWVLGGLAGVVIVIGVVRTATRRRPGT
jgi:hypothetical protein